LQKQISVQEFAKWRNVAISPSPNPSFFSSLRLEPRLHCNGRDLGFAQRADAKDSEISEGQVVLTLSGRIQAENVAELQRFLELERVGRGLILDLKDVTLVDRDAVKFLARCEVGSIELKNCPAYIREWIEKERGHKQSAKIAKVLSGHWHSVGTHTRCFSARS